MNWGNRPQSGALENIDGVHRCDFVSDDCASQNLGRRRSRSLRYRRSKHGAVLPGFDIPQTGEALGLGVMAGMILTAGG
jgi:hypothetical protein